MRRKQSKKGRLNLCDLGKGLLVSAFSGLLAGVYNTVVSGGQIDAGTLKTAGGTAIAGGVGYLIKKLGETSEGKFLGSEAEKPATDTLIKN